MSGSASHDPRHEQERTSDESIQEVHATLLREKPEPSEGAVPIPLLLLGLIGGLVFFAGVYFERYSGSFAPLVYNEEAQGGPVAAGPAQLDPIALGKRLYVQNCVACHQANGSGLPGTYPPLTGSEWVNGSEERVVRILLHGLSGPITVEGLQFGSAAMPAFGPTGANFKDDKIAAVMTYIRQEWGNKGSPITPEQVAKVRAASADRNKVWSAAELLEIGK